jgi:hypothetical protein
MKLGASVLAFSNDGINLDLAAELAPNDARGRNPRLNRGVLGKDLPLAIPCHQLGLLSSFVLARFRVFV